MSLNIVKKEKQCFCIIFVRKWERERVREQEKNREKRYRMHMWRKWDRKCQQVRKSASTSKKWISLNCRALRVERWNGLGWLAKRWNGKKDMTRVSKTAQTLSLGWWWLLPLLSGCIWSCTGACQGNYYECSSLCCHSGPFQTSGVGIVQWGAETEGGTGGNRTWGNIRIDETD